MGKNTLVLELLPTWAQIVLCSLFSIITWYFRYKQAKTSIQHQRFYPWEEQLETIPTAFRQRWGRPAYRRAKGEKNNYTHSCAPCACVGLYEEAKVRWDPARIFAQINVHECSKLLGSSSIPEIKLATVPDHGTFLSRSVCGPATNSIYKFCVDKLGHSAK